MLNEEKDDAQSLGDENPAPDKVSKAFREYPCSGDLSSDRVTVVTAHNQEAE